MLQENSKEKLFLSLNLFLQFLGHGLYGVFIPVFILKEGFGLFGVFQFGIFDGIGSIVGAMVGPSLVRRFTLRFPIVFRALFQPFWLLLFRQMVAWRIPLPLEGFLFGVFTTMYWLAVNSYTVDATKQSDRGVFAGFTTGMVWLASVISPLAGALIIRYVGYDSLFSLATAILLLAAVPALLLPRRAKRPTAVSSVRNQGNFGMESTLLLLFTFVGGSVILLNYAWPAYVFRVFGGELGVGILASIASGASLAGALGGGYLSDRFSKTRLMASSSAISALTWIATVATTSPFALSALVALRRLADESASSALFAKYGNYISGRDVVEGMGKKQLVQGMGQTISGVICVLVGMAFSTIFVLYAVMYLAYSGIISETKFSKDRAPGIPRALLGTLSEIYRS